MESRDEVTEVSKPRNQAAIFKENKLWSNHQRTCYSKLNTLQNVLITLKQDTIYLMPSCVYFWVFFFFSQIFSYCYNLSQYMFKSQNYSLWISRYGKLIFNFYFLLLVLTSDFLSGFTKVKMLSCVLDVLVCETMTKKNYLSHPIEGGIYYIKTSTFRHLDTLVI